MKWEKTLSNCGLTEQTISIGLKTKIKEHRKIEEALDDIKDRLNDDNIEDDEVDELEQDLRELEDALEISDDKLVRAVELYDKNKDKYAELSKNLGKGRPRKNPTPTPTPTPQPTQTQTNVQEAQPNVQQTQGQPNVQGQNIPITPTEEVPNEEKKGSGWLWKVGVAIVVGVLTLGAYNTYKNND